MSAAYTKDVGSYQQKITGTGQRLPTCRRLAFGGDDEVIDHEQVSKELKSKLVELEEEFQDRWSFNFRLGQPVCGGAVEWTPVIQGVNDNDGVRLQENPAEERPTEVRGNRLLYSRESDSRNGDKELTYSRSSKRTPVLKSLLLSDEINLHTGDELNASSEPQEHSRLAPDQCPLTCTLPTPPACSDMSRPHEIQSQKHSDGESSSQDTLKLTLSSKSNLALLNISLADSNSTISTTTSLKRKHEPSTAALTGE